ncbi:MAG: HAMP domain-containing sensor histidine kinase [Myxococcota bacterium]
MLQRAYLCMTDQTWARGDVLVTDVVLFGRPLPGKVVPAEVSSGFDEFERRGLEGAFKAAVVARIALLVGITSVTLWLAFADPAIWRRVVLGLLIALMAIGDIKTRRRFMRYGVEPALVHRNMAGMAFSQVMLLTATGGLVSPLLPILLPGAFLSGLLADRWGLQRIVGGVQIPAILVFTAIHVSGVAPSFVPLPFQGSGDPSLTRLLFSGGAMILLTSVFGSFGYRLRREARRNLEQLQSAQEAALAVHRQRADDLTMMSGEIAHELKNPLASVKGLTQLLARGCSPEDTKASERLGVLQREVVRMQSILDEFLNFSRPLTPLTRTAVDVQAVCADVVSLHEAMSAALALTLHVDVETDLIAQGDARKIGQVLINLLQNALEVSPPESEVWLRGVAQSDGVLIEVRDAGPGLSLDVEATLFEPGVTTKADGNGLGLTVARAIAEQHGGTLTLANHPEGGCIARLFIPNETEDA